MKIKTIVHDNPGEFDNQVNRMLGKGYILGERRTISLQTKLAHYAQMVQLDEPEELPEPQPLDPFEALRQLQEFCDSNQCEGCQLYDFCTRHLPKNEGPADWELPGEEAPEA